MSETKIHSFFLIKVKRKTLFFFYLKRITRNQSELENVYMLKV